jgi:hypothetical protein
MTEDIVILTICVPPIALFLWWSLEGLLWEDENTKAMRKKKE